MASSGELLLLAVLLGCSAFFSGAETALFSLSGADLAAFAAGVSPLKRRTAALAHDPRGTLAAILLGNQFVNIAFFAVSAELLIKLRHDGAGSWFIAVAAVAPLGLLVVFGEICPKNIALAAPRGFSMLASGPITVLVKLLGPINLLLVAAVEPLTRLFAPGHRAGAGRLRGDELHRLMQLSERRGLLAPDETRWIGEVLHLSRRRISEIMVPRVDMVCFDIAEGRARLRELFADTSLSRLPVYKDDPDNLLGFIQARRLILEPDSALFKLIEPAVFVPELATIEQLLIQLRLRQCQSAIVVDEYGGVAGLVAMEDAIEEIVGDLATEGEHEPTAMRELADNAYLVDGSLSLRDWSAVFGECFNVQGVTTIGGAVTAVLERMAVPGDRISLGGLTFTVREMAGRRIRSLIVAMNKEPDHD